ncbi:MAG TPA: hypothetical protein VIP46_20755 [Pyrinomonadaceae bacterium]
MTMLREAKFMLEPLGEKVFDGYTRGENWNGWACPYFTSDQARQLVRAYEEKGLRAWYDEDSDAYSFEVEAGAGVKETDTFPAEDVEGLRLYPIGASCWIWEEV